MKLPPPPFGVLTESSWPFRVLYFAEQLRVLWLVQPLVLVALNLLNIPREARCLLSGSHRWTHVATGFACTRCPVGFMEIEVWGGTGFVKQRVRFADWRRSPLAPPAWRESSENDEALPARGDDAS